jgi:hypothetical protein
VREIAVATFVTRALTVLAAWVASVGLLAALAPASLAAPSPTPSKGECYTITGSALDDMAVAARPLDCALPHTVETYRVAKWRHGNPYRADKESLYDLAWTECADGRPEMYLGIPITRSPFSRVVWHYFFPTEQQWSQGERWIRCDVGLRRGWTGLQSVSGRMADLVQRQGVQAWAWCTKSRPTKSDLTAPAPCAASPRPWLLVTSTQLRGSTYPGYARARALAAVFCKRVALRSSGLARPDWYVYWSSQDAWTRNGRGVAWCYMNLRETRWG